VIGAFRSELLKLRARTYWVGTAGMGGFMAVTMLIAMGADATTTDRGPAGLVLARVELVAHDGLARSLGNGVTLVGIAVLTVIAINTGTEFSSGTVRNLLVFEPRRSRLLLGKTLALFGYVVVAVSAAALVGVGAAFVFAPGNDVDTTAWLTTAGVRALGGALGNLILASWGWAALGLLLAVVLRSAAAAIGTGVAYALPAEILLTETVTTATGWLPGQVWQTLARGGASVDPAAIGYPEALARSVGWIVVAVSLATLLFHRRELTD
jgi:ABC-2 type transport system permease protein